MTYIKFKDIIAAVEVLKWPTRSFRDYPAYNAEFLIKTAMNSNYEELEASELQALAKDYNFIQKVNDYCEEQMLYKE